MNGIHHSPTPQEVYNIVSNHLIAQLEKKVIPWHVSFAKGGLPQNLISGKPYSGLNVWLLAALNYAHNVFLTQQQAQSMGATIKNGEKGHLAIYYTPEKELRYSHVFNIAQCENIPPDSIPPQFEVSDPIKKCKRIAEEMPKHPAIDVGGAHVFYSYQDDTVHMPDPEFFHDRASFFSSLFYGLMCSTGHEIRLNRKELLQAKRLATPRMYSTDDLIAEMGATYLCGIGGIEQTHLRYDYFDAEGWLYRFRTHNQFAIVAGKAAQAAVNYILNIPPET
ncbi:ArdC-like ssDNA-binding domain-containing protein [Niastella populi]|uniref:DUF1738 domain-containing protein n=1 Tax=Niastella populi TaxID=550983 RepID=A0A1V9GBD6_9BACT|nr:ArdC-like ssDNA-binding domain-containing protein [Niastella populi]OQP67872.1 hypothetical protein A4R26_10220 [Niastella populi]